MEPIENKTIVVTGANAGIGKAMATKLASQGARVAMVCRNPDKGERAKKDIVGATGNDKITLHIADIGEPDSIRQMVSAFEFDQVDVLMNNAGVYLPTRQVNSLGHERTIAINHLGAFLLTHLMWSRLAKSPSPRVINTSSLAHRFGRLRWDNLHGEKRYVAGLHYGVSKLCNILHTRELAKRGREINLNATSFHPGTVGSEFAQDEKGMANSLMKLGKGMLLTPEQGGDTGVFLATHTDIENGGYYANRKKRPPSRSGRSDALSRQWWVRSRELLGISD